LSDWFANIRDALYWKALHKKLVPCRLDCTLSLVPDRWSPILPNIVTVWDLEHRRKPYFPELASKEWGWSWEKREENYRTVLPKAVAVITGTRVGKAQVERFYGVDSENIRVIPFPTPSFALERGKKQKSPRKELPAGVSGEFIFYPAQYWPHKNHVHLLQAIKILAEQYGWDGALVCCGSDKGNLRFLRQRASDLGVEKMVHFLGFVSQTELVSLYQHSLALTFLSYLGPDNLPPLEAFALGCPVIAGAIDGAEESLGSAVLYVNPDHAADIAAAVWRIKNENGLRENLIAAGKTRAAQSTAENYIEQLIHLLDALETRWECFRK